jgi:outer membrane lipoprotein-sorting protein
MHRRSFRVSVVCLFVLAACGLQAAAAPAPAAPSDLARVLVEFDRVQSTVRTLSSEFTETIHSSLLKEPIVAHGRVFLTKPDSVRWEYTAPEEMRFVIARDQYTGYFPARKQAEKRDIRRWRDHLFRFLGIGQASTELSRFYDVRLGPAEAKGPAGAILLILEPKRKRVRKRVDEVRFWVSAQSYLPMRIEYSGATGTQRVFDFAGMRLNPDLAASLYRVDLPPDVVVTEGFSALSGFSSSATP